MKFGGEMKISYLICSVTMFIACLGRAEESCKSRVTEELQLANMGTYDRPLGSKTSEKFDSKTIFSKYQLLREAADRALNTPEVISANQALTAAESEKPRDEARVENARRRFISATDGAMENKARSHYEQRDRFFKSQIKYSHRSALNERGVVFDSIVTFNKQDRRFEVFIKDGKVVAYDLYIKGEGHLLVELNNMCKVQKLSPASSVNSDFHGTQITPNLCKSPSFNSNRIQNFSDIGPGSNEEQLFRLEVHRTGAILPTHLGEQGYKNVVRLCDKYKEKLADVVVKDASDSAEDKNQKPVR